MTRARCWIAASLFASLVLTETRGEEPGALLQKAYFLEFARCDPEAAIAVYRRVLRHERASRTDAAKTRLRVGFCYETLGDIQSAQKEYEIVVARYADDIDAARLARQRLDELAPNDPARFMPPDVIGYVELVNPGNELERLAEALRGTPFENPVDSSITEGESSSEGASSSGGEASARQVESPSRRPNEIDLVAAIFNRSFFRELSKIGGLALCTPAGVDEPGAFIGVASLGGSDVLPGIVTSFLTIGKPPRVGFTRGLPVYRLEDEEGRLDPDSRSLHLAFGGDILVWGQPRREVEAAVERFFSSGDSLASNPDFKEACSQRPDALLFAYLGPSWVDGVREDLEERQLALFDGVRPILELDRLGPVSARITSTALSGSLKATVDVRTREKLRGDAWSAVATPPLESSILRPVPADSVAFFALRFDDLPRQWRAIERNLSALGEALDDTTRGEMEGFAKKVARVLESPPGKPIVDRLRSLVVGAVDTPVLLAFQSFYVILELEEPDAAEASVRDAIALLAKRLDANREIERKFESETRRVDDIEFTLHRIPTVLGVRLSYVRIGSKFVVSISETALTEAMRAARSANAAAPRSVPARSSKVLYLRPEAMVRMGAQTNLAKDPTALILSHVKRALIYTREREGGVSIELEVPELKPTLRAVLNTVAELIERRREQSKTLDSPSRSDVEDDEDEE